MEIEAVYNTPKNSRLKVLGISNRGNCAFGTLAVFYEGKKKCSKLSTIRSNSGVWAEIPKGTKAKRLKIRVAIEFETGDFSELFYFCGSLAEVLRLDTSNGTDFSGMFEGCSNLAGVPLLDTSDGTDFSGMFYGCSKLESAPLLDTGNGTNFSMMFYGCKSLSGVPLLDTGKGKNFRLMFYGCPGVPEWAKGLNVA